MGAINGLQGAGGIEWVQKFGPMSVGTGIASNMATGSVSLDGNTGKAANQTIGATAGQSGMMGPPPQAFAEINNGVYAPLVETENLPKQLTFTGGFEQPMPIDFNIGAKAIGYTQHGALSAIQQAHRVNMEA